MKANIFSVLQVEPFRRTTNQQPESESINQATDEKNNQGDRCKRTKWI